MSETLRDEAHRTVAKATDYMAEAEKRGVPKDVGRDLRDQLLRLLDEVYRR